jgi:hypothetical protein
MAAVKGLAAIGAAAGAADDEAGVGAVDVVEELFEHAPMAAIAASARAGRASLLLIIPGWMRVWVSLSN